MAEPRITARMLSPAATALDNRLSTPTPHPSPRPKPPAEASKALHRPSGDNARKADIPMAISGVRIRLMPPASARLHSFARRLWQARWTAASADEQAVSTVMHGPCSPRRYDRRPAPKHKPAPEQV